MLGEGGHLGFIVSNRFFKNKGAKEIRGLLAKNRIHEIVDFTDYQLFEGATNYSAIINVEKLVENDDWDSFIEDGEFTNKNDIKTTRVRDWDKEIPELVEQIESREPTESIDFFDIDSRRFQEKVRIKNGEIVREDASKSFTSTDQEIHLSKQLPLVDVWPVAPPQEYELIDTIEENMEMRLGDKPVVRDNSVEQRGDLVGDDIRVGVQTSGDSAYIVEPQVGIAKEKLGELSTLTITPRGIDKSFTVETDLLKVDITGDDAARWLPDWSNRLVFIPYIQGDDRARLIRPEELASQYPKTWEYFTSPEVLETLSDESRERNGLHARLAAEFDIIEEQDTKSDYKQKNLSASQYKELSEALRNNVEYLNRQDNELWWYRFMRRQNIESLPNPKVLTGNQAQYNKLSFDDEGIMAPHNARVYAILIEDDKKTGVAGVLNSAVTEFYHKQHARIHSGKAYSYIEDYTSKWPVVVP
ncbi:MAG: Eco57I restriction-modification methylase domain-containing protein, partial [Halobacteriaceae archaeon]